MLANPDRRIRWLLLGFALLFAAIVARASYLQVVQAQEYSQMADSLHVTEIDLPARRGTIYDRNGNELAVGEEMKTIYVDPRQVEDPVDAARRLAPILGIPENELYARLTAEGGFSYLARKLDPAKAEAAMDLGIDGLGTMSEEKRVYPQKQLASQVLGYAGIDNEGLAGLELEMNYVLAGDPGRERVMHDVSGKHLEMLNLDEGRRGTDIRLTIDQSIQYQAEKVLDETVDKWEAKGAVAIVMDPDTGDIYAMVDAPTADANRFGELPEERRRNRAVTDTYEPGSVFKAFTATAGLEEGAIAPGERLHLPPVLEVGGRRIKDSYERGPVDWDLQKILENSSNVGAAIIGMRVGPEKLDAWIRRLGFGKPTGIDFPGEATGIVLPLDQWSGSTIGNVPMGQGIGVTAIQMATGYCVIANGGFAVKPRLVAAVGDDELPTALGERLISGRTTSLLRRYLTTVVDGPVAPGARVDGYEVAGKTGTAQKPLPDGSGYSNNAYVSSFIGMVPADDPQLVILVVVDEPHPSAGGAEVAAPAFGEIAAFSLQRLGIAP